MMVSIEISMYPLQDEHIPKIEAFLHDIREHADGLEIRSTNMSTRVFGEFDAVTALINSAMKKSMQEHGRMVFVCKYLDGDARQLEGYA